jgi:hypothetical protein
VPGYAAAQRSGGDECDAHDLGDQGAKQFRYGSSRSDRTTTARFAADAKRRPEMDHREKCRRSGEMPARMDAVADQTSGS